MKRKRGAPVTKWTPERISKFIEKLDKYILENDIPIAAEFAYINGISKQTLYDLPELSDSIKRLISKKEANLEKLALYGEIDKTMAIFSLKQLGWRDKTEVEVSKIEVEVTIKKHEDKHK
jgi:hypothetical protein